jgi:hypothetical protein
MSVSPVKCCFYCYIDLQSCDIPFKDCGHCICSTCLKKIRHSSCPMCRAPIPQRTECLIPMPNRQSRYRMNHVFSPIRWTRRHPRHRRRRRRWDDRQRPTNSTEEKEEKEEKNSVNDSAKQKKKTRFFRKTRRKKQKWR